MSGEGLMSEFLDDKVVSWVSNEEKSFVYSPPSCEVRDHAQLLVLRLIHSSLQASAQRAIDAYESNPDTLGSCIKELRMHMPLKDGDEAQRVCSNCQGRSCSACDGGPYTP